MFHISTPWVFLVRIFLHSNWIRTEICSANTDKKISEYEHFLRSAKVFKIFGFQTFSGVIELEHWPIMSWNDLSFDLFKISRGCKLSL